mgnify:CR=1 FL=1
MQELINGSAGLKCITPQTRYQRLCVTDGGDVIAGVRKSANGQEIPISEDEPGIQICFEPLPADGLGEKFDGGLNQDIREQAAAIALKLELLAGISSGFGLFDNGISDVLADSAQLFWSIAYADVLENDIVRTGAGVVRNIERLLMALDPGDANSKIVEDIREIIDIILRIGKKHI